jgi:hypothetical protein
MKKLLILTFLFNYAFSSVGFGVDFENSFKLNQNRPSKEITGTFSCRVTKLYVLETTDGIAKEYFGQTEYVKVGDEHVLVYRYTHQPDEVSPNPKTYFQLQSSLAYFSSLTLKKTGDVIGTNTLSEANFVGFRGTSTTGNYGIVSENLINIKDSTGSLQMFRYFKNDWQGVLTGDGIDKKGRVLGVRVYGLDCRHTLDNLEKIFNDAEGRGY